MNERSQKISRLLSNDKALASYLRAKLSVLIPAQLRALRTRRKLNQTQLANAAGMKQSQISGAETPGAKNFTIETLVRLAVAMRVGLIVKFATYSEVLKWENEFSQDHFDLPKIEKDAAFIKAAVAPTPTLILEAPTVEEAATLYKLSGAEKGKTDSSPIQDFIPKKLKSAREAFAVPGDVLPSSRPRAEISEMR